MNPITLSIAPDIQQRFPDLLVGGFIATGVLITHEAFVRSAADFEGARSRLAERIGAPERFVEHPSIVHWRSAIRSCGLRPSKVRGSVEQLGRRLLKHGLAPSSTPLVDAYCLVSVDHFAPIGAYDINRLPSRKVKLRTCRPGDVFNPLGGDSSRFDLGSDVVIYGANKTVLCYAFNHRDSKDTCLTSSTTDVLFVGESVAVADHGRLHAALDELMGLLKKSGAGTGDLAWVDNRAPSCELPAPG
jgi:DNA/RNA-binding domain of Phe-tRNA-synthetase-like protein